MSNDLDFEKFQALSFEKTISTTGIGVGGPDHDYFEVSGNPENIDEFVKSLTRFGRIQNGTRPEIDRFDTGSSLFVLGFLAILRLSLDLWFLSLWW